MAGHDDTPDLSPHSRRRFLAQAAGLSTAALALADSRIAAAQAAAATAPPPAGAPATATTPAWQIGPFDDLRGWVRELERRGLLLKVRDIDQDRYEGTALMYRLVERHYPAFVEHLAEQGKLDAGEYVCPFRASCGQNCIPRAPHMRGFRIVPNCLKRIVGLHRAGQVEGTIMEKWPATVLALDGAQIHTDLLL